MESERSWQDALTLAVRASSTNYRINELKGLREKVKHHSVSLLTHHILNKDPNAQQISQKSILQLSFLSCSRPIQITETVGQGRKFKHA
jgi:hypothetical protein